MAAYRRVYDSHHLQADCQEPGSAPIIEYGLPLPFLLEYTRQTNMQHGSVGLNKNIKLVI